VHSSAARWVYVCTLARAQAQQVPPLIEEDPVFDFGAFDCIAEVAGAQADCEGSCAVEGDE